MFKKKGINTTMTLLNIITNQLLLNPEVYDNRMLLLSIGIWYTFVY
jgi:hypothetical protein